jgi:hypothetical protein
MKKAYPTIRAFEKADGLPFSKVRVALAEAICCQDNRRHDRIFHTESRIAEREQKHQS